MRQARSSARNAGRHFARSMHQGGRQLLLRQSSVPSVPSRRCRKTCGHALRTVAILTPTHLAEKIPHSKSSIEGEREQVGSTFADLKGSMDLSPDHDSRGRQASSSTRYSGA